MSKEPIDSKIVSITPTLTSLLKPTADMLGSELRDYIKEKVDAAKDRKKADNVKIHVDVASRTAAGNGNAEAISVTQLDLFSDWVEYSGNVDPRDTELATMWQNLLVEMSNRKPNSSLLLEKLKQLQPEDAHALNKFGRSGSELLTEEDRYRLFKLEQLELIEPNESNIALIQIGIIIGFLAVILLTFQLGAVSNFIEYIFSRFDHVAPYRNPLNLFELLLSLFLPIAVYVFTVVVFFKRQRNSGLLAKFTKRLTWIGRKIVLLTQ